jgi:hypothetical protein
MAVSTTWYRVPVKNVYDGTSNGAVDWNTDTIKIALLDNGHTPAPDSHDFLNDVEGDELANGNGYTTGGGTLTTPTVTVDSASDEIRLDADDEAWTTATFTARYGVIYKDAGGATSADPLIGLIDFDGDQAVSSGTFTIVAASTGYLKADAT